MAETSFHDAALAAIPEMAPYFAALDTGELLLKQCDDCSRFHFYPRVICPHCHGPNTTWRQASGGGRVYSFSLVAKADKPFNVAFVTLDEGITLLSCVVDCAPEAIHIDQRVHVVFRAADNGMTVPMFAPGGV